MTLEILLAAVVLVGLCVFGLCFNIIFRKDGQFPEIDLGANKELRKRGIICAKEDEMKMWKKKGRAGSCDTSACTDCRGCDVVYGPDRSTKNK